MTQTPAVDHIYCINLDRRTDRWDTMEQQFQEQNLEVERFSALEGAVDDHSAVNHNPGQIGCLKSHAAVLRDAIDRRFQTVMVLEDDVVICPRFTERLNARLEELPWDWETFYITGIIFNPEDQPIRVSSHISRNVRTFGTMGIVLKATVFPEAIKLYDSRQHNADNCHADVLQKRLRSYISMPFLAYITLGQSDIADEGHTTQHIYDRVKHYYRD